MFDYPLVQAERERQKDWIILKRAEDSHVSYTRIDVRLRICSRCYRRTLHVTDVHSDGKIVGELSMCSHCSPHHWLFRQFHHKVNDIRARYVV